MSKFTKATKSRARLRLAIDGPSGAGKTYSALAIASGLGKRIAVLDTERGSASLYADMFAFDVLEMADHAPQRYIDAIHDAEREGYDVIVVDSLSHAWMGRGGALEMVDAAAKRSKSGNSFAAWRDVTPVHHQLVDAMLASTAHVIATMRSKSEWVLQDNGKGKMEPRRVGLAAVQRDGMEYEFTIVLDVDLDHNAVVAKTRWSEIADKVIAKPGRQFGADMLAWLDGGPSAPVSLPSPAPAPTPAQQRDLDEETVGHSHTGDSDSNRDPITPPRKRLAPGETHPALAPREPDRRDPTAPDNSHRDREGARITARMRELAQDPPLGLGAAKCRQILGQTPMDTIPRRQAAVRILETALVKAKAGDAATVDLLRSLAERADLSDADCDSDARDRYGRPVSALTAGELAEMCERLQMLAERLEREIAGAR